MRLAERMRKECVCVAPPHAAVEQQLQVLAELRIAAQRATRPCVPPSASRLPFLGLRMGDTALGLSSLRKAALAAALLQAAARPPFPPPIRCPPSVPTWLWLL